MKKFISNFAFFAVFAFLMSCNNDLICDETVVNPHDESIEAVVKEFVKEMYGSSKKIKIDKTNYSRFSFEDLGQLKPNYRLASRMTDFDDSVNVYIVSFKVEGRDGFAVVGEINDYSKVYYYTENGTYQQALEIDPLSEILDDVPYFVIEDITLPDSLIIDPSEPRDPILEYYPYMEPLVITTWSQGYPYNMFTPLCNMPEHSNRGNHHTLVGCGGIAIGQFVASQGGTYTTLNGNTMFISDIGSTATPPTNKQSKVATFLNDMAVRINTSFGCESSSSYFSDIKNCLETLGYNCITIPGAIDNSRLISNFNDGYPHIMYGWNSPRGHFWIVDGIYGRSDNPFYHCNWGWGGYCDGWCSGTPYTSTYPTDFNSYTSHIYFQ